MWCDFQCDGCPSYADCARTNSGYDIEEIQYKTIRTTEEYNEMYRQLAEECWDK